MIVDDFTDPFHPLNPLNPLSPLSPLNPINQQHRETTEQPAGSIPPKHDTCVPFLVTGTLTFLLIGFGVIGAIGLLRRRRARLAYQFNLDGTRTGRWRQ